MSDRRHRLALPIALAAAAIFALGFCCSIASFFFAALGGNA